MTVARGVRNKNPGNIEASNWTQRQPGYVGKEPEGRFAVFDTFQSGIAAQYRLLKIYRDRGLDTLRKIINTWAPPSDGNDVSAYLAHVQKLTGYGYDDPLPDTPETYRNVAWAMACHECGADQVGMNIGDWPFLQALGDVFPEFASRAPAQPVVTAPPPAPQADAPPAPAPVSVQPKEKSMSLPLSVAVGLATELWRILRPTEKVEKVAGAIEKATPALLSAARQAVPTAVNEQQAVQEIKANPQLQTSFRLQAMTRWDDIEPLLRYESEEREKARTFAERMTDGNTWRSIGYGALIAILSLLIIAGGGWIFTKILFSDGVKFSPSTVDGIVEVLKAIVVLVVGFFFGSSVGSKQAGRAVEQIAERKP